jgi:hypothetical protein
VASVAERRHPRVDPRLEVPRVQVVLEIIELGRPIAIVGTVGLIGHGKRLTDLLDEPEGDRGAGSARVA